MQLRIFSIAVHAVFKLLLDKMGWVVDVIIFGVNNTKRYYLMEINFRKWKLCHISRGFILRDAEISIILRWPIFAVARYVCV